MTELSAVDLEAAGLRRDHGGVIRCRHCNAIALPGPAGEWECGNRFCVDSYYDATTESWRPGKGFPKPAMSREPGQVHPQSYRIWWARIREAKLPGPNDG